MEIDPNSYFMCHTLGMSQFFAGRNEDAIRSLKRTVELAPWYATAIGSLASAYHRAGDQGHAREWAQRLAQSDPDSLAMAEYYATTGDVNAMFEALEGAYGKRDVFLVFIKVWPSFDPYRADLRFQSLLKRPTSSRPRSAVSTRSWCSASRNPAAASSISARCKPGRSSMSRAIHRAAARSYFAGSPR